MSSKLAVQMYTVREHTKTAAGLGEALRKIRAIGYEAVQLSAIGAMTGERPEVDARAARRMLDDQGLQCIATHRPWDKLIEDTAAEIDFHHTLGCDYVAIGGAPDIKNQSMESFRKFAREAEELALRLAQSGLRFGYHNHSIEFFRWERRGLTMLDVLIDECAPALMLELDLYWIEHAGADSRQILERCHGRVPVIHVKDKEVVAGTNDTRMSPIGEGNLNWDSLIPACESAGVRWYGVEQDDCYRDPFDCLKSSFEFLSSKGI